MTEAISDHALIRFLERAYRLGPLIEAARQEMENGLVPAIEFGASVAVVHNTRLIIRDGVVVTAIPKADGAKSRAQPHRRRGERS